MGCRVALGTEHWGKRAEKDDSSEVRGVQPGWLVRWSESSTCSSFCAMNWRRAHTRAAGAYTPGGTIATARGGTGAGAGSGLAGPGLINHRHTRLHRGPRREGRRAAVRVCRQCGTQTEWFVEGRERVHLCAPWSFRPQNHRSQGCYKAYTSSNAPPSAASSHAAMTRAGNTAVAAARA